MNKSLNCITKGKIKASIHISGSKSESNRALILQRILPYFDIENLSDAEDTHLLQAALNSVASTLNIHHAGTAMRFLTAFFAILPNSNKLLTGSERMLQRPIGKLVTVLQQLGADITYEGKIGFPPIRIKGKKILAHEVEIDPSQSSQFITAMMLVAPALTNGLQIKLTQNPTSAPYIKMTQSLLEQLQVKTNFSQNLISILPFSKKTDNYPQKITIESDWSSASYYYSLLALAQIGSEITLSTFKKISLQGDSIVAKIYESFGVTTTFNYHSINVKKTKETSNIKLFKYNFTDCPDLAQTVAITCLGLGIEAHFTGLHTLKVKETDRIVALKNEIKKFGAKVTITDNSLQFIPPHQLQSNISITTYNDHRMAMAFAPLCVKTNVMIEHPKVVSKSYPKFWEDFEKVVTSVV